MSGTLVAVLLLQPVLTEAGDLRLVAVGTGNETVEWLLDGVPVAVTRDGEAVAVAATAGEHTVVARTAHAGSWSALVRHEPRGPGVQYVPAWTARWEAPEEPAVLAAHRPDGVAGAAVIGLAGGLGWLRLARRTRG